MYATLVALFLATTEVYRGTHRQVNAPGSPSSVDSLSCWIAVCSDAKCCGMVRSFEERCGVDLTGSGTLFMVRRRYHSPELDLRLGVT